MIQKHFNSFINLFANMPEIITHLFVCKPYHRDSISIQQWGFLKASVSLNNMVIYACRSNPPCPCGGIPPS